MSRRVRPPEERIDWKTAWPFFLFHLLPLGIIFTGISWPAVWLCVGLYFGRMFFITAGYHRYFAHRSYKVSRPVQFVLAFGGGTAVQKGVLWWAGHHRDHHRYVDTDGDPHTPQNGFWWSHVLWITCDKHKATDFEAMADFAKFPELRFLNRWDMVPWLTVAVACFLFGGGKGLFVGFFLSTVLLWHGTFTVNSLAHVMGRRRFATFDTSRNSWFVALITMGEGWHNNHHHYPPSARQGFYWYELDLSFYLLRFLEAVGLVKDLRRPTEAALAGPRLRDGHFDIGMFRALWNKVNRAVSYSPAPPPAQLEADTRVAERLAEYDAQRITLSHSLDRSLRAAEDLARLGRRGRSRVRRAVAGDPVKEPAG